MKTLFPPYAHPSPALALDADTWIVQERPGRRRSAHQVLGRVDLDWGGRSLADVLADVDAWREDGVEGLFLDRAPAGAGGVGPVALTVRLAARRGLHRIVLNPGVPTNPLYRDLGVRICTFDGPWSAYQGWDGDGVRAGDGHIVHGVPSSLLTAARRLMGRRGAGFGLATDASPWFDSASGAPSSGAHSSGAPSSGPSSSGAPSSGALSSGPPSAGAPFSGPPSSGAPFSAPLASAPPSSGAPSSSSAVPSGRPAAPSSPSPARSYPSSSAPSSGSPFFVPEDHSQDA